MDIHTWQNPLQQERAMVYDLLQRLWILTDACPVLDGLQKLRHLLIQLCYSFINQ